MRVEGNHFKGDTRNQTEYYTDAGGRDISLVSLNWGGEILK